MANLEKHKKSDLREWLEATENSTVPAQSRSSHVLGAYIKIPKAVPKKRRSQVLDGAPAKPEPALMREPSPPVKLEEKRSQPSSPEHLRKVARLPKLRAPFSPSAGRPSPAGR
jgi:hypothetical protein